jgi:hypothetical protein
LAAQFQVHVAFTPWYQFSKQRPARGEAARPLHHHRRQQLDEFLDPPFHHRGGYLYEAVLFAQAMPARLMGIHNVDHFRLRRDCRREPFRVEVEMATTNFEASH